MIFIIIALGATLIGAVSGLGGGVIIKPLLDLFTNLDVSSISFLSSATVFTMATTSLIKHIRYQTPINYRVGILLSIGAILGGNIGDHIFNFNLQNATNPSMVTKVQNILLIILMILVLLYINKFKSKYKFHLSNPFIIGVCGIVLGTLSSYLGIGGGPINVAALSLLFSMSAKDAAVNSLLLIFFSQLSKISTVALTTGFSALCLTPLWVMVPCGVVGGFIGSYLNKKLSSKVIITIFNASIVFVILVALSVVVL